MRRDMSLPPAAKNAIEGAETVDQTVHGAEHELNRALGRIESEVRDGLGHGFFELSVTCEVVKEGKRRLTIKAGKSYQFIIAQEEVGASKIA
jgi:hypothetical protein